MDMAMSGFQASSLGGEQSMMCRVWACRAGKYVPWGEFHGFMAAPVAQVNPVGFQEMPLMKVEIQPYFCDSFHFVLLRGFVKHEHLFYAGRQD